MAQDKIFVGRKAELEQFKNVLEDPQGHAVLVVGHRGMGKSWLADKMAELAENHPNLKCGCVRYEVTPTDSVDSTMALMMDNAFEAAQVTEGSFDSTPRRLQQWKALLNVIKIGDLAMSLRREPTKNTREQFLERLQLISKRMPKNGRAIFIIDPEKYMQKDSDQSWAIIIKELPDKIKLIFAQRTEDVLVESATFASLDNISRIPEKGLGALEEQAVDDLLDRRVTDMVYTVTEVRKILSKYKGHPYALQGALYLLKAGTKLEDLPQDPTGIAAVQWKELCKRGKDAIRLIKAYAILEVGVPDEVVASVSELDSDTLQSVQADNFLAGLLREEGYGKRIYHAILTDHIVAQMSDAEKKQYHAWAVEVYHEKLKDAGEKQIVPDALAATRLFTHVKAMALSHHTTVLYLNECFQPLFTLGLLDTAEEVLLQGLDIVEHDSKDEAATLGNLGLVYRTKGNLDQAQRMFEKSLEIHKRLRLMDVMANDYANIGLIYAAKADWNKAELMHRKALDIDERIGNRKGMAAQHGNLGGIYRTRGDLDKAETMYRRALEISETLNDGKGMALQYGNLGQIHRMKGLLNDAEEMHKRSLEIAEKIGLQELIARNHMDLGLICVLRRQWEKAESMLRKALQIDTKLGRVEGIAYGYSNLGSIYYTKGEPERAEQMFKKSLEISERLGLQEVTANQYSNLGGVCKQLCDTKRAREYWAKARGLYEKIGMAYMVEKIQGWIDELDKGGDS